MNSLFEKLFGKKRQRAKAPSAVKNEASGELDREEPPLPLAPRSPRPPARAAANETVMPFTQERRRAFEEKVQGVSSGHSKTHALGVALLEAASDGNEGELDRCLRELPSTGAHHGAHLTPLIDAALDLVNENHPGNFKSKLNDWKLRFLDTLDGLSEPLGRMPLAGNYLALMHMPGMPHSSRNYHLVTVWFEDGTAIRHARVFDRSEMEVPAAWKNKKICNMAFLLDQP